MRSLWGQIAAVLVCVSAGAMAQSLTSAYSNCKFGYEVVLPGGVVRTDLGDGGFEIRVGERDANGGVAIGKVRVVAMRDPGWFSLWQQNGRLLWTSRVAVEHGRTRLAEDWERAGGLLLLEWRDDGGRLSGHMAHAQRAAPPELRYAALRREDSGEQIVYTFTLTGAAAATPWMRNSVLRRVLEGFRTTPLACGATKMASSR